MSQADEKTHEEPGGAETRGAGLSGARSGEVAGEVRPGEVGAGEVRAGEGLEPQAATADGVASLALHNGPLPRYRGAIARLLGSELKLAFTRRRNIWLLAGLAAVPVMIGLVVFFFGNDVPEGHGPGALLDRIMQSGAFLSIMALFVSVPLLLPLVTGVIAGDSLAGEAQPGTLRYVLTVPVSRTRLIGAKAVAVAAYLIAGVALMWLVGLLIGGLLFGWHGPTLLSGDQVSLGNGIARVAGASAFAALSLMGLAAVGMFISSLTEVPIAAMAATAIVAVVSTVLDQLPQLSAIHGALLTHYWLDFLGFLQLQVDFGALVPGLLVQLAWVAVFGSLAWARFVTKDVTC